MIFWQHIKKIDWPLWALAATLVIFGAISFHGVGDKYSEFIEKQIVFLLLGTLLMIAVSFFDYRIFKNFSVAPITIYILALFLLFVTLGFQEIRGVHSWIVLGNITVSPSEFAKLAVLILLAKYFSQKHVEIYNTSHIVASGLYVLLPAALTLKQPDLGSTLVFVAIWLAMLLFSGVKRKHLLIIMMVCSIIASLAWVFFLETYQKDRITSFINPYLDPRGKGYNLLQSQTAIGSGRIWGDIWVSSAKKPAALVPEPYNDFAFAIFAKKFGFIGVISLFTFLMFLVLKIISIAKRANNNFAKLFSLGFITLIFSHVFINAGMNLGLLPITGIPFSFLSYGGSHLATLMAGLGIIQNIQISNRKKI